MIETIIRKKYFPLILFLFAFGLFSFNNHSISIYILDEAKNAGCAREMLEQGEIFKPTFNYNLRTDKPPLHYFFMMSAYSLFGVNEWSARFFSAVFGALTILVSFIYTRKFADGKTAFYAALILLSSIHLTLQFHLAVPDPYLIFFFTWSVFLFYSALKSGKAVDKIFLCVSTGLAALAKGPVAIGLAGLIFLVYLIATKQFRWKVIQNLWPFTGAAIVLVIASPWFIVNGLVTNWEWTYGFFVRHNLQRFASEMEGHGGIFLVPLAYVFIGVFPFTLFALQAFRKVWKEREDFLILCLVTVLVIVTFFAVSQTKLPNYTVPSYPFLAILIANYLSELRLPSKSCNALILVIFGIMVILPFVGYFLLRTDGNLSSISAKVLWLLLIPVLMLPAITVLKSVEAKVLSLSAAFMLGSVLAFGVLMPAVDKLNPVSKSLKMLEGREVAYYKRFNPGYSFYIRKKIPEIHVSQIDSFFNLNPGGVLISVKKEIDKISLPQEYKTTFECRDLLEAPVTVLITKNPD